MRIITIATITIVVAYFLYIESFCCQHSINNAQLYILTVYKYVEYVCFKHRFSYNLQVSTRANASFWALCMDTQKRIVLPSDRAIHTSDASLRTIAQIALLTLFEHLSCFVVHPWYSSRTLSCFRFLRTPTDFAAIIRTPCTDCSYQGLRYAFR